VAEKGASALPEYARVSSAFVVKTVIRAEPVGDAGEFVLTEQRVASPYVKDDARPGAGLLAWRRRELDAAVVYRSAELDLLERRDDLAVAEPFRN
jgi:hypothetical protein